MLYWDMCPAEHCNPRNTDASSHLVGDDDASEDDNLDIEAEITQQLQNGS